MKTTIIFLFTVFLTNICFSQPIIQSDGNYICDTCNVVQEWYIDQNHILHWNGQPYIPHAINDYPLDYDNVDMLKDAIDFLFNKGVTDFKIFSYEYDIPFTITKQLNANDSNESAILFDGISLVDSARNAGYPIASDEWLIGFVVAIDTNQKNNPQEFALSQNYPNPFNPSTTIEYHLPQ